MFQKRNKFKLFTHYLVSSLSIILVLFILAIILLLSFNAKDIAKQTKENFIITIILKDQKSDKKISSFIDTLKKEPFTKQIKFVSKQEALEQIKAELGQNIDQILDYNPLPATIDLKLKEKYANADSIYIIRNYLLNIPIVDDVYYNKAIINQLDKNLRSISLAMSTLAIILIIISIVLIDNIVRLTVYNKRFEIKTMQMVGANFVFILKPFIRNALIHGILSSLISISLMMIVLLSIQTDLNSLFKLYHLPKVFFVLLLIGTAITSISTVFSVFGIIRKPIERLYL